MTTYSVVFCDEVRQEVNGKHFLIGVYGTDLLPSALPATVPIALWIRIVPLPEGKQKIRIELEGPGGGKSGMEAELDFSTQDPPSVGATIALGPFPVQLQHQGDIIASIQMGVGKKTVLGKLRVTEPRHIPTSA